MADSVSQAKIFADFGAVAGIAGVAGGSVLLKKCKSFDVKDGRSTEVQTSIGVENGSGFRRKQGGLELELQVYREVGKQPEVDWYALNNVRATFTITTQDEFNGRRNSYTCQVSKIDEKKDSEGMHEDTVTLAALRRFT
jgi:hypothetical protein